MRPGTILDLHAINRTKEPYDVWAFWIDADHGVTRLFPDPDQDDASPFLVPSRKSRETAFQVKAQEVERIAIDARRSETREHRLRVAAPTQPSGGEGPRLAARALELGEDQRQPVAGPVAFTAQGIDRLFETDRQLPPGIGAVDS